MKKFVILFVTLLAFAPMNASATELSEAEKMALKAEVEAVAEQVRLALQNQDYEKFISLIIPAQPAHNFTKETFAKCLAGERCKKYLLKTFTLADSTIPIQFLDLRQEGDYILYYRYNSQELIDQGLEHKDQGLDYKNVRIVLSAFKRTENGIKIFGKGCGKTYSFNSFEGINNLIAKVIASSDCLSNPIKYWEEQEKQNGTEK